jgi:hypothetical protein
MGVASDVTGLLVDEAVARNPSGDVMQLMNDITAALSKSPPVVKPPKPKPQPADTWPDDDLRRIVASGKEKNQSAHAALLAAGVVRSPLGMAA